MTKKYGKLPDAEAQAEAAVTAKQLVDPDVQFVSLEQIGRPLADHEEQEPEDSFAEPADEPAVQQMSGDQPAVPRPDSAAVVHGNKETASTETAEESLEQAGSRKPTASGADGAQVCYQRNQLFLASSRRT